MPLCGKQDSRVLDSRASREGAAVRRRRECTRCSNRFTTMVKDRKTRDAVRSVIERFTGGGQKPAAPEAAEGAKSN